MLHNDSVLRNFVREKEAKAAAFECENDFSDSEAKDTDEKKFVCELCSKEVKTVYSLRRHMKIHSGQRPHVCDICDRSFIESGNLRKHIRMHRKEKKHQCNQCGFRFYERNKLMSHIKTHTGEKQFSCEVCSRAFTTPAQVQVHMKVVFRFRSRKILYVACFSDSHRGKTVQMRHLPKVLSLHRLPLHTQKNTQRLTPLRLSGMQ